MLININANNLVVDDGGHHAWVRTAAPWDNLREVRQWVQGIVGDDMTTDDIAPHLTTFSEQVSGMARAALDEQIGHAELDFDPTQPIESPRHEAPVHG